MADFRTIREISFSRASRSGKPEQLKIQLIEVKGRRFVSFRVFWLNAANGEFCPPSRDSPTITIRRSEAEAVIGLLRETLGSNSGEGSR
jgi:hypothetical protein